MDQKETITLIRGQFSAEEAKEIVMNVIATKIHFHQLKNLSSQERFGKQDDMAVHRIQELEQERVKLLSMNAAAQAGKKMLSIASDIKISLVDSHAEAIQG